jgi:cold-inducible RNA-binding protein
MSFQTTEDGLRSAFERFGEVLNVNMVRDRETGRARGFAFVEMANAEEADRAITGLNGTSMDGRALTVNEARPKSNGGGGGGGGRGRGGNPRGFQRDW